MLDKESEEYKKWSKEVRTGVYTSMGVVTLGMILADIFGCLGLCSLIGNTAGWGSAIPAVEVSINK